GDGEALDDTDDAARADGPRTLAVPRPRAADFEREITFATRIAPAPAPVRAARRRWWGRAGLALGATGLLALAALAGARLRDAASVTPLPAMPRTARLALHVLPPDAEVTVDGRAAAPGVIELPAGRHQLAAR